LNFRSIQHSTHKFNTAHTNSTQHTQVQQSTHKFNTTHTNSTQDCLLIQNDNENKCSILTISYLHQLIKQSQKFFSNDPRCKCFAPLSVGATNFENGYHKKELLCSPSHKDWPTGSLHTNIHETTSEF